MDGVSDLKVKGNTAGFIFKGNINAMMKKLSDFELCNISIEEPDLEEIFMHYYAKEA
jgi:ABC-2 type transport system ATP-binding protein